MQPRFLIYKDSRIFKKGKKWCYLKDNKEKKLPEKVSIVESYTEIIKKLGEYEKNN